MSEGRDKRGAFWPAEWMDSLPVAILLLDGNQVIDGNDRARFLLGLVEDFAPFDWCGDSAFQWRREDRSYFEDRWGSVGEEERVPIRMELEIERPGGSRFQCEVRLSPAPNGKGLMQLMDISEQRFRQQALQDREAHYRRLTDIAQEGIALVQDGVVLDVNSRFLVMMGVEHPVASMEHQYFITEDMPGVMEAGHRIPLLRCPISDYYSRQEKNGLLVGFYEQGCKTWGMDGIDPKFSNDLCPDDLDRVMDVLEGAISRMPALAEVGIKQVVNGPITYTIDGTPLVGPIPGKRNAFCIIGLRAGLGEGGGHGWLLAQQIVHGEACYDTWALDPRRFTGHATQELTSLYAIQDYQNEFRFHLPHEHRPAGRPAKTTPLTPILEQAGAHFTVVNGWERSDYFKPTPDFVEDYGYSYTKVHELVAAEVARVQNHVALAEVNGFNRIEITGPGARDWLDYMICSRVPRKIGKLGLGYLLNDYGNVKAEATIANLPDGRIWYGSAAAAEFHDMDWLSKHLPKDGSVTLRSLTNDHTILVLAGPKSRAVLSACARGDWSAAGFPWLSVREARIGHAPAIVMSVSFSGELAYEIHLPNSALFAAYSALMRAGAAHDIGHFGARAVDSMRMEKGYLHWKSDLITEFDPYETGLDRFVCRDKDFLGKTALMARGDKKRRRLRMLEIDATHASPQPSDSLYAGGRLIGSVTSADWGHRTGKNIAYAFMQPDIVEGITVDIIGKPYAARLLNGPVYDPDNSRVTS